MWLNISDKTNIMINELSKLLEAGKWRLANEETHQLLVTLSPWQSEIIKKINNLWQESSQNRFGICVQVELWKELGGHASMADIDLSKSFEKLGDVIGWRKNQLWVCLENVECWSKQSITAIGNKDLDPERAPKGLLPFHDVLSSGNWREEFSPRDCWGEAIWYMWAKLFRIFE